MRTVLEKLFVPLTNLLLNSVLLILTVHMSTLLTFGKDCFLKQGSLSVLPGVTGLTLMAVLQTAAFLHALSMFLSLGIAVNASGMECHIPISFAL